jgi:hypothetical protein
MTNMVQYFAKIENGIVTQVIVASSSFMASDDAPEGYWLETCCSDCQGKGMQEGGVALRGNYAGIGYEYREDLDAFIPPQPYPSWTLNTNTFTWESGVEIPEMEGFPVWNEAELRWDEDLSDHDFNSPV